jgi:hypothetical protein
LYIDFIFPAPRERFGSHSFPSPSDGSLLQFLSSLFLTMVLSVQETLMYFSYMYAPNLTHQGESIITEIAMRIFGHNWDHDDSGSMSVSINDKGGDCWKIGCCH